jgi:hypothetical protein
MCREIVTFAKRNVPIHAKCSNFYETCEINGQNDNSESLFSANIYVYCTKLSTIGGYRLLEI